MIGLVIYAVAAFGFAYIVGHALISRGFREFLWSIHLGWIARCENGHVVAVPSGRYEARWPPVAAPCTPCAIAGKETWLNITTPVLWPLRPFVLFAECPACCGFWIGAIIGFTQPGIFELSPQRFFTAFALALFTAGSNFILATYTGINAKESE